MSLLFFKIAAALIIFIITIIGGLWPFFKRAKQNIAIHGQDNHENNFEFPSGEALTSGIFLGAALLHMLPDASRAFTKAGYDYPYPFLIATIMFLAMLLLEHISVSISHKKNSAISSIVFLTVIMLSIHSLFEGAAVGIAANLATTMVIFIAIIAHKGAASFALSINLNRSQQSFFFRATAFSIFALMTPLGILGGSWVLASQQSYALLTPIFSSLAAGTFLYIGTLHGLERASLIRHCCDLKQFNFVIIGFAVMAVVAIWA